MKASFYDSSKHVHNGNHKHFLLKFEISESKVALNGNTAFQCSISSLCSPPHKSKDFPQNQHIEWSSLKLKGKPTTRTAHRRGSNLGHLLEELHHARLMINLYLIKSCKLDLILAGLHTHYDTFWILWLSNCRKYTANRQINLWAYYYHKWGPIYFTNFTCSDAIVTIHDELGLTW